MKRWPSSLALKLHGTHTSLPCAWLLASAAYRPSSPSSGFRNPARHTSTSNATTLRLERVRPGTAMASSVNVAVPDSSSQKPGGNICTSAIPACNRTARYAIPASAAPAMTRLATNAVRLICCQLSAHTSATAGKIAGPVRVDLANVPAHHEFLPHRLRVRVQHEPHREHRHRDRHRDHDLQRVQPEECKHMVVAPMQIPPAQTQRDRQAQRKRFVQKTDPDTEAEQQRERETV